MSSLSEALSSEAELAHAASPGMPVNELDTDDFIVSSGASTASSEPEDSMAAHWAMDAEMRQGTTAASHHSAALIGMAMCLQAQVAMPATELDSMHVFTAYLAGTVLYTDLLPAARALGRTTRDAALYSAGCAAVDRVLAGYIQSLGTSAVWTADTMELLATSATLDVVSVSVPSQVTCEVCRRSNRTVTKDVVFSSPGCAAALPTDATELYDERGIAGRASATATAALLRSSSTAPGASGSGAEVRAATASRPPTFIASDSSGDELPSTVSVAGASPAQQAAPLTRWPSVTPSGTWLCMHVPGSAGWEAKLPRACRLCTSKAHTPGVRQRMLAGRFCAERLRLTHSAMQWKLRCMQHTAQLLHQLAKSPQAWRGIPLGTMWQFATTLAMSIDRRAAAVHSARSLQCGLMPPPPPGLFLARCLASREWMRHAATWKAVFDRLLARLQESYAVNAGRNERATQDEEWEADVLDWMRESGLLVEDADQLLPQFMQCGMDALSIQHLEASHDIQQPAWAIHDAERMSYTSGRAVGPAAAADDAGLFQAAATPVPAGSVRQQIHWAQQAVQACAGALPGLHDELRAAHASLASAVPTCSVFDTAAALLRARISVPDALPAPSLRAACLAVLGRPSLHGLPAATVADQLVRAASMLQYLAAHKA